MQEKPEEYALGKRVNRLANLIRREADKVFHTQGVDEAGHCNGWIIEYMIQNAGHDVFQKDMEQEFSLTRSTISKAVDLLVKKGMIVRSPVEYDARLKKLTLTPKALQFHAQMEERSRKFEERIAYGFTEEDQKRFLEYLSRMEENLNRHVTEDEE